MKSARNSFITRLFSGNRKKIYRNLFWAITGKIVNIISGLFVGILIARYLGPGDYGLMNYIISYVTLFSILANFGLDNIEIRELSKQQISFNVILGTAFRLRVIFALTTILLVVLTLLAFRPDPFTFWMILVYSASLLLSTLNVIRNYFTSIILNEYVVKTEIVRTIIGAAIKIVLLLFHLPLGWFIVAVTFDFVLIASGYLLSYRLKVGSYFEWTYSSNLAKKLIKDSFPLLLSGAAIIIYQKIDQVMIKNMIDNESVGQFSVASKITELGVFVPLIIAQTVTPLLVKAHHENINSYAEKKQQFSDLMFWTAIGIALLMSLLASPAIKILFGSKYLAAIPVLQIMAWKTVFVALFAASGQIIIIENLQKFVVLRNIVGCLVSIILNILLIPKFGIIGSAIATVITMAFSGYFSHLFVRQFNFLFKIQTKSIFKSPLNLFRSIKF